MAYMGHVCVDSRENKRSNELDEYGRERTGKDDMTSRGIADDVEDVRYTGCSKQADLRCMQIYHQDDLIFCGHWQRMCNCWVLQKCSEIKILHACLRYAYAPLKVT